jgi:hypothetical protein
MSPVLFLLSPINIQFYDGRVTALRKAFDFLLLTLARGLQIVQHFFQIEVAPVSIHGQHHGVLSTNWCFRHHISPPCGLCSAAGITETSPGLGPAVSFASGIQVIIVWGLGSFG